MVNLMKTQWNLFSDEQRGQHLSLTELPLTRGAWVIRAQQSSAPWRHNAAANTHIRETVHNKVHTERSKSSCNDNLESGLKL